MIFVMFGTNPYPFIRLLNGINKLADSGEYEIVAQTGTTPVNSENYEHFDYIQHDAVKKYMEMADVIITQGGFGSLKDGIKSGKPVIALPRRPELNESQDDQEELVDALTDLGLIIKLDYIENIESVVVSAQTSDRKDIPECNIPEMVATYVDEYLA